MNFLKKIITLKVCLILPASWSFWILNLLGHQVSRKSKIGFSLLWITGRIILDKSARIGHLNVIKINNLSLGKGAYIDNLNKISGPLDIVLESTAAIGNSNRIARAPLGVTYNTAVLKLGILSKITANHRLDCTRSIVIGDYTTIAGHDSQLWTHAYYHDKQGPGRFRLDGSITIGNNVYIGSRCIIHGGVAIADTVVVGSNSAVSKSLLLPGTYINQALRYLPADEEMDVRNRFKKIEGFEICEEVYEKKTSH